MRALLISAVVSLGATAHAFSIGSAFADACHERITADALVDVAFDFSATDALRPPVSDEEKRLAAWLLQRLGDEGIGPPSRDERLLNSFLVGVRHPDVEGWQLRDLSSIRSLQLDLSGQSAHFLRAQEDRGDEGSAAAIARSRAYILALLDSSRISYELGELVLVPTWIEHYPEVKVPVLEAAYLLAQALHALQDSFSHAYRTEDAREVNVVLTYLGAFNPEWNERTFGPQHNDFLDRCNAPENEAAVRAATQASRELMVATVHFWKTRDRAQVEAVLDRRFAQTPGCTLDDHYCASPTWALVERKKKTGGCSGAPGAALVVGAAWLLRRRRSAAGAHLERAAQRAHQERR